MAMITALAVAGGSFAAFGAAKYFEPEIQSEYKSEEESEEDEHPEEEAESEKESEQEVETEAEPEPVQQPEKTESVQEAIQEPVQEEQQGGQKGGIGRPTWAAVKQGETIQDVVGIPGSTASNFIAKATGTYKKTPDEIQLSLKNVDDELRVLQVQQFRLNSDYKDELDKFNGIVGTTGIREKYQEILGRKKYFTFMENYYSQKISSFNGSTSQTPPTTNTGNLQEDFDKEFKKDQFVKPVPPSTTALKTFDQWLEDSIKQILGRKKRNFRGESPPNPFDLTSTKTWYSNLKNKSVSQQQGTNSNPLTFVDYKTNVTNEINASKEKEIATYQESEYKPTYDKSLVKLTELRSRIEEVTNKLKELKNKKELLLTDLSNYETPTFWSKKVEVKKSTLPTGIELQTLLNEYKSIQNKIKDKQDELNDYISLHIEDTDDSWTINQAYTDLIDNKKILESDLKTTIQKIEGRNEKQQITLGQLNELDIFIKLLKDNNVKAYKLFETDFRKVYDIIVKLSNDTNILPTLDKYYRFFGRPLNNLKLSSYNGENVDKVMLFFNTYQKIVKDDLKDKITKFLLDFDRYIIKSKNNIQDTISLVQANDPKKLKEELDKLDSTQRAILEGRSPTWQLFLENTPKLNLDFIFKTDLQKLQKIKDNFQKRIVDKLETQNITKPLSFEKQKYVKGEPTNPIGLTLRGFVPGSTAPPGPPRPPGPPAPGPPAPGGEPGSAAGTGLQLDPPTDEECITYVNGELTGEERTQRQITEERVNELVTDDFTIRKVKICLANLQIAILPPEPGGEPPGGEPPGPPVPGPPEPLQVGDFVKLIDNPRNNLGCLSDISIQRERRKTGKITEITEVNAKVKCYAIQTKNGIRSIKDGRTSTYLLTDLIKTDENPEQLPLGGYTRRQGFLSKPSRRKTRRT